MKKGQIYEGIVTEIEFPNKGMISYREEDREYRVTVKGVLPGQKVSFALRKKHGDRCEGHLMEVFEHSSMEDRKEVCPHADVCGGCFYQRVSAEKQREIKEQMLKKIMDGAIKTPYEFEPLISSPIKTAYRNKMEFSFGDEYKDGPLALGMHKKGSFYDIVTVTDCQIVNEDYRKILIKTLDFFKKSGLTYYHKLRHIGYLRHLVVRRSIKTGEILVNLVTSSAYPADEMEGKQTETEMLQSYCDLLLEDADGYSGKMTGILHTVNDSLADVVQSDRTDILYGKDYITEEILGLQFKISAFSFFQTNSLGAEVLYGKAREYIGDTKDQVVFDLYSGTGTIAQMLAKVAKEVIGVEIVEEAVEAAKENAALNQLNNCRFIAGDVLKVLDDIPEKPDFIVLDPPRDGIHPKALEKIIRYGVKNLVYISCKPTSLARDLLVLQERGYRVEKVCGVDQFPMTTHVETVVLLQRKDM